MNWSTKGKQSDLLEYLQICESSGVNIDVLQYPVQLELLENEWYTSLEGASPRYEVYEHPYYLMEVWKCWKMYSQKHIQTLLSKTVGESYIISVLQKVFSTNVIVDIGCGCGYTTAALKEIFSDHTVYGTNISNTKQYEVCTQVSKMSSFTLTDDIKTITKNIDLLVALEYFEHFERPVEHLIEVLHTLTPSCIMLANSFNTSAIGHFNTYKHYSREYTGKQISKVFMECLKHYKYIQLHTNCWNSRPSYFINTRIKSDNQ